jgi:hypothetical protein
MMRGANDRQASLAAVVTGLLVFGVPGAFVLMVQVSAWNEPWPAEIAGFRPSTSRLVIESLQFGLVFAALAAIGAWRTRVHALQYLAGRSVGWRGVGEAAACAFMVAVLYLALGIVTRPREAPPYVIIYGGAATVLGAVVGLVLRAIAMIVLRLSRSAAASGAPTQM